MLLITRLAGLQKRRRYPSDLPTGRRLLDNENEWKSAIFHAARGARIPDNRPNSLASPREGM